MIAQTNGDVANGVNAHIGTRGGAGGSAQQQLLARELAKNETGLRYGDYTAQTGRRDAAARSLADITGAQSGTDNNNLAAMIAAAQAGTSIPQSASNSFADTIAKILAGSTTQTGQSNTSNDSSGYNYTDTRGSTTGSSNTTGSSSGTGTEKSEGDLFSMLLNAAASAGSAALFASDRRLKENVERIGELSDGLGVYEYDYRSGFGLPEERQMGVMADEVELLRPWALGPVVNGYATVNYAALGG